MITKVVEAKKGTGATLTAEQTQNTVFRFVGESTGSVVTGAVLGFYTTSFTISVAGVTQTVLVPPAQSFRYLNILGFVLSFAALIVALRLPKQSA